MLRVHLLTVVLITVVLIALFNTSAAGAQSAREIAQRTFPSVVVILTQDSELRRRFEKQYKLASDPRVTRVGRFLRKYSLDEFPSFFSILRGEISLVGPRTITRAQQKRYGPLLPKLLSVKPGLTGFWQVMGRQTTSYEEKVQLDMFYIDHWSIWLDLVIIFKTFWAVIRAEGAY